MSVFSTLGISASALTAERLRMDVVAANLANVDTTRTASGEVYYRKEVVFRPLENGGVKATAVFEDRTTPTRLVYQPEHPDADARGMVEYPNVVLVNEMVDLMAANRAYQANITALNATKEIMSRAINIGR
ncbi:MAG: flagellar basal-body rod protein FlgC [Candidatus Atribacteria bacterium]|nr:flagellar basal-body rod protein FlgC [Candidatus Atribacteria bacterium]